MAIITWESSEDENVTGYAGGIRSTPGGSLPEDYTLYDLGDARLWLLPPTLPAGTYYVTIFAYITFSDTGTFGGGEDEVEVVVTEAPVEETPATLIAVPSTIQLGSTALLMFSGPPNATLEWVVTGDGTLSNVSESTNSSGAATAVLTANTTGSIGISVNFGG